ncbi:MAG: T9SS-dependent M36 family metallopeptidase [Bacteroidia bacterium]|nr:T9SS-dependent M36 family metallopeptidase [Bacteroidia bacterium]
MKYFLPTSLVFFFFLQNLFAGNFPETARKYLEKNRLKWNLTEADIASLEITDQYISEKTGLTYLYFRQVTEGIGVSGSESSLYFSGEEKIFHTNIHFIPSLQTKISASQPAISAQQAIYFVAQASGIEEVPALKTLVPVSGPEQKTVFSDGGISQEPIAVKLMYLAVGNVAKLTWNLQIYTLAGDHWWDIWVNAENGQILKTVDWVDQCHFPLSPPQTADIHGANEYHVFPLPLESPSSGPRSYIFDPSEPLASPFGWHDNDGVPGADFTFTRGNNAWAREDHNADNEGGNSAEGGPSLDFDFPLNLNLAASANTHAAITNLFYWNNLMHDLWYLYGFDEVSGNFQENNYGRGGKGADYVRAEAQDGSGRNNANFATPPDSLRPRMQMFLWGTGFDTLRVAIPGSVTVAYPAKVSSFGPPLLHDAPITGPMIIAVDTANTTRACVPISNSAAVNGKIAVIDRGNCDFVTKVLRVQAAGAIAAIVVNNVPGPPEAMWTNGNFSTVTIPSIMVGQTDGDLIKLQINSALMLTGTLVGFDMLNNPGIIDGDFDNGVIAHEYGHGISNRMTGGPSNVSCLSNQEQAGEGWSDWFALVMTTTANSLAADARTIGTFVSGQAPTGAGLRPYPYSTDMNLNPSTYDNVKSLSVPHGVGFVMATMLWDLYWNLVDLYGYDPDIYYGEGGNNIAMRLVMEGLRLQPCSPGFTDVRDAILLADELLNGSANECLIWKTFARRGLGYSATQGSPNDRSDGGQAFDRPPQCLPILAIEKTTDREKISQHDSITYTLTVRNQTDGNLTNVIITDTLPAGLIAIENSLSCSGTISGNIVEIPAGNLASGQSFTCTFQARVSGNHPVSVLVYEDDLEENLHPYSPISQAGSNGFRLDTLNPHSPSKAWFVPNAPAVNDQILMMPAQVLNGKPILSFWHSFDTEAEWDGGLIEILPTVSSGQWQDLGSRMIENGYNSKVGINNPAGERPAFSGNSKGYIRTKIDLSPYAGEPVFIRFRFVSDDNTHQTGWWIDDLLLSNGAEVNLSNTACVSSSEGEASCDSLDFPHIVVSIWPTKIEETPAPVSFEVYPNPGKDEVRVSVKQKTGVGFSVEIVDLAGREILRKDAQSNETTLSITSLPAGIYLVKIFAGGQSGFRKLIVE